MVVQNWKLCRQGCECEVIVLLASGMVSVCGEEKIKWERAIEKVAESYECATWGWKIE
jgi:hypothetical protein